MSADIAIKNNSIYNIHNINSLFTNLSNENIYGIWYNCIYFNFFYKNIALHIKKSLSLFSRRSSAFNYCWGNFIYSRNIHIYDEKKIHRKRCSNN